MTQDEYDKDIRKEHRTILKSYAGLLTAIIIAIFTRYKDVNNLWLILSLLSVSIPSAIGSLNIERITDHGKANNSESLCLASTVLIYVPSIIAISLMIGTMTTFAGTVFATMSFGWLVFIVRLRRSV